MCLIMHREKDQPNIEREFFEDVWDRNSDGWGVMWTNAKGQVKVKKGLELKDFWSLYRGLETCNVEIMIHFRMRTDGDVNLDMCHPFKVIDGVYLMHNGMINHPYKVNEEQSDTWAFVRQIIQPMLEVARNPHAMIRDDAFIKLLEEWCGTGNKLVFCDRFGFQIINHAAWRKTDFGLDVSNTYAYNYGNPTKKHYGYGGSGSKYSRYGSWGDYYGSSNYEPRSYVNGYTPKKEYFGLGSDIEKEMEEDYKKASKVTPTTSKDEHEDIGGEVINLPTPYQNDDEGLDDATDPDTIDVFPDYGDDKYSSFTDDDFGTMITHLNLYPAEIDNFVYQTPEMAVELIDYLLLKSYI